MADTGLTPEALAKAAAEVRQVREADERAEIAAEHIAWQDLIKCKIKKLVDYEVGVTVEENAFKLVLYDHWYEHRLSLERVPCTVEQRIQILAAIYGPVPQGGWRVYDLFSAISAIFREQ